MIVTTTGNIDGYEVKEYKSIVFGEVLVGMNLGVDIATSFTNIIGGRGREFEEEVIKARYKAIEEMKKRATNMGANAILGIKVDYEPLGNSGYMTLVCVSGTAVVVAPKI